MAVSNCGSNLRPSPHRTLAFPFNVMAFPINVMAFPINVMALPINGMAPGLAAAPGHGFFVFFYVRRSIAHTVNLYWGNVEIETMGGDGRGKRGEKTSDHFGCPVAANLPKMSCRLFECRHRLHANHIMWEHVVNSHQT